MKKILTIIFSVLSIACFSQPNTTYYKTYKNSMSNVGFSGSDSNFKFNDFSYQEKTFSMVISDRDSVVSTYNRGSNELCVRNAPIIISENNTEALKFDCVDEYGKHCYFSVVKSEEESYILVMYENKTFIYSLVDDNSTNLNKDQAVFTYNGSH